MSKARVLFLDIETSANLGYTWSKYETNVIEFKKEFEILSIAYKWADRKKVCVLSQREADEKVILGLLHCLLDSANVVVWHNGDRFDGPKGNARFIAHGMKPPSPYKSVDTKKVAKRYFSFNSNKLDDLGKYLGVGRKVKHEGFDLWLKCMAGDKKALKKMEQYNKGDVRLLEKVYKKLLPWIQSHPNVALISGRPKGCPKCGSEKLHSRGTEWSKTQQYQRYQCQGCGGWCRGRVAEADVKKPEVV